MIKCRIASLAFDVLQRSLGAFIANEIDIQLWTQCFYRLYAEKRANLQAVGKEEISAFIAMTNEGAEYYEYLIRVVSTISDRRRAECIYPFYIHLGDIYRYKAGVTEKDDKTVWKKCESCYREAIQINPNNGNAFHQLAIVATSLLLSHISPSQHRATCLALYYCIRAISCDRPFVTAFTNIAFHFERNKEELEKVKGLSFSLPRKQRGLPLLSLHPAPRAPLFQRALRRVQVPLRPLPGLAAVVSGARLRAGARSSSACSSSPLRSRGLLAVPPRPQWLLLLRFTVDLEPACYLTPSCLIGWTLLFRFITAIMHFTAIPILPSKPRCCAARE